MNFCKDLMQTHYNISIILKILMNFVLRCAWPKVDHVLRRVSPWWRLKRIHKIEHCLVLPYQYLGLQNETWSKTITDETKCWGHNLSSLKKLTKFWSTSDINQWLHIVWWKPFLHVWRQVIFQKFIYAFSYNEKMEMVQSQ